MVDEPNLYTCSKCGYTVDVGNDDLAGDEDVVRQRIAHEHRRVLGGSLSPWLDVWEPVPAADRRLRAELRRHPAGDE